MLIKFEGQEPTLQADAFPDRLKVAVRRAPSYDTSIKHGFTGAWLREVGPREIKSEGAFYRERTHMLYDITPEPIPLTEDGYSPYEYLVRYWDERDTLPSVMPIRFLVTQYWVDGKSTWRLLLKGQITHLDLPSI